MSVYVDRPSPSVSASAPRCFRGLMSCHMYADTLEELHTMAAKIRLKPAWFQCARPEFPHYDLVPSRREHALRLGAVETDRRHLVEFVRRRRSPIATLAYLLRDAGAVITFSINCCSGIVSLLGAAARCECWRCRENRGEPVTDETEALAAEISRQAQVKLRECVKKDLSIK
jgi:hypothetical protein